MVRRGGIKGGKTGTIRRTPRGVLGNTWKSSEANSIIRGNTAVMPGQETSRREWVVEL
jgi:hypothetical protein